MALKEGYSLVLRIALSSLLGLTIFLVGFLSEDVVTMIIGLALTFLFVSSFLMQYVKIGHKVKKVLEVVSAIIALVIIVYGYALTGELILIITLLFILAMFFIAFILSYLLPRIRIKLCSFWF